MAKKPQVVAAVKQANEIPEVAAYLDELELLEEFRNQHKVIFENYMSLLDRVNQRMVDADKAVRGQKVSCGPWNLLRVQRKYDTESLRTLLGETRFFELGGSKRTVVTYEMPDEKIEAAAARNEIPAAVISDVVTETPFYSAPKLLKL